VETKPDGAELGANGAYLLPVIIKSDIEQQHYRSLIALSLIMALLQFKLASMYIFDETDACSTASASVT
jgi:hypothetical protein